MNHPTAQPFDPKRKEKLLSELDQQILDHYLELDEYGKFVNPPSTDDELHEFIEIALQFRIPRKVIEPGHSSPFQFVADLFFGRVKNAIAFANRNGGKTVDVAALNLLDMTFKHGCEVGSAGATKKQAKKCYEYFQAFMEMSWFKDLEARYQRVTGNQLVKKAIQEETSFATGSMQEILTATTTGLRSPHPHKARIDEVDEIDWATLQTGLSMARSSKGIRGQNVFTSTRQHAQGTMQRLLDEADAKGFTVYEWNCWESVKKCERRCKGDPEHGDCPIYVYCKGKAHHCDGFYEIEDFIDKVRTLDPETFETEWENKKPSREKLVYNEFDQKRHVMTPSKLFDMFGFSYPSAEWRRTHGIDFGASPGHPFVYLKICQLPGGRGWLIYHEYVAEQKLMNDHCKAIKATPHWSPRDHNYADTSGKQERIEMKKRGVKTKDAIKDVKMGIDLVKSLLQGRPPTLEPLLYVWHECEVTIKEFGLYSWPTRPDGKPDKTGVPRKEHDHCMDAARYGLYSLGGRTVRKYTYRNMSGI